MTKPRSPLFVERTIYRRRRLMDAARLLPVVALVLILLPVMWSREGGQGIAAEAIYLFALWAVLVLIAAVMSGPLRRGPAQPGNTPPRDSAHNPVTVTPDHRPPTAPQTPETPPVQPPAPPPSRGRA